MSDINEDSTWWLNTIAPRKIREHGWVPLINLGEIDWTPLLSDFYKLQPAVTDLLAIISNDQKNSNNRDNSLLAIFNPSISKKLIYWILAHVKEEKRLNIIPSSEISGRIFEDPSKNSEGTRAVEKFLLSKIPDLIAKLLGKPEIQFLAIPPIGTESYTYDRETQILRNPKANFGWNEEKQTLELDAFAAYPAAKKIIHYFNIITKTKDNKPNQQGQIWIEVTRGEAYAGNYNDAKVISDNSELLSQIVRSSLKGQGLVMNERQNIFGDWSQSPFERHSLKEFKHDMIVFKQGQEQPFSLTGESFGQLLLSTIRESQDNIISAMLIGKPQTGKTQLAEEVSRHLSMEGYFVMKISYEEFKTLNFDFFIKHNLKVVLIVDEADPAGIEGTENATLTVLENNTTSLIENNKTGKTFEGKIVIIYTQNRRKGSKHQPGFARRLNYIVITTTPYGSISTNFDAVNEACDRAEKNGKVLVQTHSATD